jgi:signal transduction histidine kinase
LVTPLSAGDSAVGILDIFVAGANGVPVEDAAVYKALADQIAIVVQISRMRAAEAQQRHLAERLNAIGRVLSRTLDLEEILDIILQQLASIVPYDRGAVMLEDEHEIVTRASRGFPDQTSRLRIRVPVRDGDVYDTVATSQSPLVIPEVKSRPDWQYVEGLPPARSWLGVPLSLGGSVIGMLSLTRETGDSFVAADGTIAGAFAHQAAIALNNARLYSNLTQVNEELEQAVSELQHRTGDLQNTYEKLRRLDQAKSDFIAVASHELRTPLTVLSGYSQILLNDPEIADHTYRAQLVRGMQGGAKRLQVIIDDMLDMARIDNRALDIHPEPLFVAVLLKSIRLSLQEVLQGRQLTLTLDDSLDRLPLVEADINGARKVFYHLMVNAVKYTPDGGEIRVWGRALPDTSTPFRGPGIEVVVSDTGIGVDPSVQDLIFAKFYQTGRVSSHSSSVSEFKGGGPGLGLAIARGIVEAHEGQIWVVSPGYDETNCPGSDFHVVLPVQPPTASEGARKEVR